MVEKFNNLGSYDDFTEENASDEWLWLSNSVKERIYRKALAWVAFHDPIDVVRSFVVRQCEEEVEESKGRS